METNKTYRWECPRGHRNNNHKATPPSCCPACGWSPDEGDAGRWFDVSSGWHWDPDYRYVTKAEG